MVWLLFRRTSAMDFCYIGRYKAFDIQYDNMMPEFIYQWYLTSFDKFFKKQEMPGVNLAHDNKNFCFKWLSSSFIPQRPQQWGLCGIRENNGLSLMGGQVFFASRNVALPWFSCSLSCWPSVWSCPYLLISPHRLLFHIAESRRYYPPEQCKSDECG